MRSYPSWIAGLRYRGIDGTNRGRYCCRLRTGDRLDLVAEPENSRDENAVAVKHDGHHLGYIPARHDWIARAMGEGQRLSCAVTRVETEGLLFRRASFVGVQITVEGGKRRSESESAIAAAEQRRRERRAREACIDGLRILAYMAMADEVVTSEETNVEISYIETRLATTGIDHEAMLTDAMLALSQGLIVTKRSLTRAVNVVAEDREYFKIVLGAVLRIVELGGDPKGLHNHALECLSKAGKAKGWI
jgi:HIRAN domain